MNKNKILKIGKDLIDTGESFVIAKVIDTNGSTPRKRGAWMLMRQDGSCYGTVGGGKLEAEVQKLCIEVFKTHKSKQYHFDLKPSEQKGIDMRCGGAANVSIDFVDPADPDVFFEDADEKLTVLIFGAGHVGQAIAPLTHYLDFNTIVLDDRLEYANRERFPEADQIIVFKSYSDAFCDVITDEKTYIIIVTRGHSADYEVLKQALTKSAGYIGMIGSRSKVAEIYRLLREDGVSKEQLDKVYSPIGLKIYAETPEEIAVSIAAELIQVRRGHGK